MEHWNKAERIAQLVEGDGAVDVAHHIRDSIAAGATGTEIVMAVRYHCQRALRDSADLSDDTKSILAEYVEELDHLLR